MNKQLGTGYLVRGRSFEKLGSSFFKSRIRPYIRAESDPQPKLYFTLVGWAAGRECDDEHPATEREDRPDGGGPALREAQDQGKPAGKGQFVHVKLV